MDITRHDDICRRFYENGESLREIARDYQVSHTYVWSLTRKMQTADTKQQRNQAVEKRRKEKSMSTQSYIRSQKRAMRMVEREIRQQAALKLLRQRMSEKEIARHLNISIGTVRMLIAPYRTQVNAEQLEAFRVLRDAGKSYAEIANTTGYSLMTVRDWLNLTRKVAQEADQWIREQNQPPDENQDAEFWFDIQMEEAQVA